MAAKKKSIQRVVTRKSKPKAKARKRQSTPPTPMAAAPAPAAEGGMNFAPLIIFILIIAGIYFVFRKDETPAAHKVAAGLQVAGAPAPAT